jgi:hypothetical protein
MPLRIDQGGEYAGEHYLYCDSHTSDSFWGGPLFEGYDIESLKEFVAEHEDC